MYGPTVVIIGHVMIGIAITLFGGLIYHWITGIRPFCACDRCEDKRIARRRKS